MATPRELADQLGGRHGALTTKDVRVLIAGKLREADVLMVSAAQAFRALSQWTDLSDDSREQWAEFADKAAAWSKG